MNIRIKTNSARARLAAKIMKTDSIAIVFGSTIYLWNCSRENFLKNTAWLRHETAHVLQFRRIGFVSFCFLYVIEHIRNGYDKNRFETEAREKEFDDTILNGIHFV